MVPVLRESGEALNGVLPDDKPGESFETCVAQLPADSKVSTEFVFQGNTGTCNIRLTEGFDWRLAT